MVELVIDCLWVINMGMCFTTAFYKDVEIITDLKAIAFNYLSQGFFVDFVTTFPTLCTGYMIKNIYYVKILRLYYINKSSKIIKIQVQSLE